MRRYFGLVLLIPLGVALVVALACSRPAGTGATPAGGGAAPAPAAKAEKPPEPAGVKVGALRSGADSGTFIAMERGYFKEQAIDIEMTQFDASPQVVAPLGTGQLDVGGAGINAALFNSFARGIKIKIVADRTSVPPGNWYNAVLVRKDLIDSGAIKDYSDLRGKTIAINARGASNEIDVEKMLALGSLKPEDVNITVLSWPDMVVAFGNRGIDVGLITEPLISRAVATGVAARWKAVGDVYPNHTLGVLEYSPQFLEQRPEVAKRFMIAYLKGVRDYNDAFFKNKGKREAIDILTRYTTVTDPELWATMAGPHINPNGLVDRRSIATDQDWYFEKGLINQKVDLNELIDDSFVRYALEKIGEYK